MCLWMVLLYPVGFCYAFWICVVVFLKLWKIPGLNSLKYSSPLSFTCVKIVEYILSIFYTLSNFFLFCLFLCFILDIFQFTSLVFFNIFIKFFISDNFVSSRISLWTCVTKFLIHSCLWSTFFSTSFYFLEHINCSYFKGLVRYLQYPNNLLVCLNVYFSFDYWSYTFTYLYMCLLFYHITEIMGRGTSKFPNDAIYLPLDRVSPFHW